MDTFYLWVHWIPEVFSVRHIDRIILKYENIPVSIFIVTISLEKLFPWLTGSPHFFLENFSPFFKKLKFFLIYFFHENSCQIQNIRSLWKNNQIKGALIWCWCWVLIRLDIGLSIICNLFFIILIVPSFIRVFYTCMRHNLKILYQQHYYNGNN